jgi:ABC-type nitrate/sulfonate/bicarbonate transport system substrate-binding protein
MYLKRLLGGAFLKAALLLSACGEGATSTSTPASATSAPALVPTEAAKATTSAAVPTTGAIATPAAATATEAAPATGTGEAAAPTPYSGPIQKVSLALDWTPNTNHTGFYVAQQKGWYKEQGIDLEILPYSDAASPDALVAAGKADFAISFVEQVVIDRVSDLPVRSVAAIVQHNTSELATLKSSGLDRPAKLAGKRYAGFGTPYEEPVIADVIKCDGGPATPIQNITTNTGGYQALVAKQADFVWIYKGWEALQAKHDNVELNEFLVRDYCVPDYYSPVIITSEAFLKDKTDVGRRFMAATARGFEFAIQQPDQAADLLIAGNPPGSFPDAALVHESAQYLAKEYQAEAPRWGDQTLQVWSGYPKFMLETGRLEDANHQKVTSLDYAVMFTNELLPAK